LVAFGSKFPKPISKSDADTVDFPSLSRFATGASTAANSAGADHPTLAVIGARVLRLTIEDSAPYPFTYVVDTLRTSMLAGSASSFGLGPDYAVILVTAVFWS
jgi:hypothetical protein